MMYRQFAVITLFGVLFGSHFTHFATADVVHAYRQPCKEDLQWILEDNSTQIPSTASMPVIEQAGFVSEKKSTLVPQGNPCQPVMTKHGRLPNPPIPRAPQAAHRKINDGLAPEEEDGVMCITSTPANVSTPVVQMSGDRLPPPAEVPKERDSDLATLPLDVSALERLSMPKEVEYALNTIDESEDDLSDDDSRTGRGDADSDDIPCLCFTCLVCGDHRKHRKLSDNRRSVSDDEWMHQFEESCQTRKKVCPTYTPDMLGSSAWLSGYYVRTNNSTFTLPTMLLTRPNVVEHFNASTQNRIWADYRHWNNAVSYSNTVTSSTESRAVEQFSFGAEKRLTKRGSVEVRVPLIYQFASNQADTATAVELGNISAYLKHAIQRGPRWTFCGGIGATFPTAEDWQPVGGGRLKNNAYYLVSFLGAQWNPNLTTFGQFVVQADMPIEKNELVAGGMSVKVAGQQVIRTGIQLGRWIYRSDYGKRPCRFGAVAEVNYAVVTEGSAQVPATGPVYVSDCRSSESTLTAAVGMPMVFGKLTCSNSLILPIEGGNHPFSVGYHFSLSRQF
ncbi:MAG: hypothetical protein LBI05_01365 [Planctomycetaceae bacterium]|nr:hypothetical protein [Planctomycetaceae bacterium]